MLYLAGIIISFFLGVILLTKKKKSLADRILAAWLMVIGFHLLGFYLFISGQMFTYPHLLGMHIPGPLLHGPLLYLYVAALTERMPHFGWKQMLHFLPAIAAYIYLIEFFMRPAEEKVFVFQHKGAGYEKFIAVMTISIIISGVTYVVVSLLTLRKHRKSILDEFSYTEKINLQWLNYLIYGIAGVWAFVIFGNEYLVFGSAVLFVMFIGYFGIRQVGIFTHERPSAKSLDNSKPGTVNLPARLNEVSHSDGEPGTSDIVSESTVQMEFPDEPKRKYLKSGLSEEAAGELHQKLTSLVSAEKPFKESELTLDELAGRLNTVPNYLSQVINDREGKNFYDFINSLRIEEFKKVATDPSNQKFTLLGLAFECGFNSKSSFNKYFKKVTGLSPSDYMKSAVPVTAA